MAYISTSPAPSGLAARTRTLLKNLLGAASEYSSYRRTYKGLASLSDRELTDIGLRRCDIERVCADLARR